MGLATSSGLASTPPIGCGSRAPVYLSQVWLRTNAMTTVNMLGAKNNLSKLVEAVESGSETEVIIARNGKLAVRIVPLDQKRRGVRLGLAKGKFAVPDNIDRDNDEIAKM